MSGKQSTNYVAETTVFCKNLLYSALGTLSILLCRQRILKEAFVVSCHETADKFASPLIVWMVVGCFVYLHCSLGWKDSYTDWLTDCIYSHQKHTHYMTWVNGQAAREARISISAGCVYNLNDIIQLHDARNIHRAGRCGPFSGTNVASYVVVVVVVVNV